ncbi:MAG: cyclic nucleotide-binding domain-containing protein [Synechococcaceae cyanobacterium SM2_3_2]|nr:cyclic nucleotide-binding domain-containing protein [Synechococcaceae cyanobacterium SM2_3_2]
MADFSLQQARQHRLFAGLDDEAWAELLIHLQPQQFQAADIIFADGDPSQGLYLLLSGQVELRRPYTRFGGDYQMALLQPGQLFGEGELLVQRRRSHTAVCLSTVAVAVCLSPRCSGCPLIFS